MSSNKNTYVLASLTLVVGILVGFLGYYYYGVNLSDNTVVTQLNTPAPLAVSSQDQSSNWNVYVSPEFKVQFKYPNFSALVNSVDSGASAQGKSDASITIRPDNNTSVNDFINAQIVNQNTNGFSNAYSNPGVEVIDVNGQSGNLVVSDGTLTGDTGRDVLVVKYPKTISITNSVGGTQTYSYMTATFIDINVGVVKEIIATMRFLPY